MTSPCSRPMCGDRVLTGTQRGSPLAWTMHPGQMATLHRCTPGGQLGRVIGAEGGTLPIDGFLDDDHPCAGLTQAMGGVVGASRSWSPGSGADPMW